MVLHSTVFPFDKKLTSEEDFKISSNKSVKVQMMEKTGVDSIFKYGETNSLQILEMPYKGDKISMLILLPINDDIKSLEKSLSVV